jgi:hypothetical protein
MSGCFGPFRSVSGCIGPFHAPLDHFGSFQTDSGRRKIGYWKIIQVQNDKTPTIFTAMPNLNFFLWEEKKKVLYLIRPPARMSKILFSKVNFSKTLLLGDLKQVNGTPGSGAVSLRRPKFWSWKAFFAQKRPFGGFGLAR